jgi:acetyl-CoA carboxylase carboxyl transferase subunit alpha
MLEHAIYSVISPEGAASILWRDSTRAKDAATNMKITAQDLLELKIIDGIIPEPLGGAHRGVEAVIEGDRGPDRRALSELVSQSRHRFPRAAPGEILAIGRHL